MDGSIWIVKKSNVDNIAIKNLRLEKSYRCPFRRILSGWFQQRCALAKRSDRIQANLIFNQGPTPSGTRRVVRTQLTIVGLTE